MNPRRPFHSSTFRICITRLHDLRRCKNKRECDRNFGRSLRVRSSLLGLFILTACSRNVASSADASSVAVAAVDFGSIARNDAGLVDAAVARVDCAEPSRLTQLGTVSDVGTFSGESLVGQKHLYDPETLAPSALPPAPPPSQARTPSRYRSVVNGVGLIVMNEDAFARVEDVAAHKTIVTMGPCSAGGGWTFALSTSGRFFLCDSSRAGLSEIDLSAARVADEWSHLGEGVRIAPNDRYAVAVPVLDWGSGQPTSTSMTYFDLDSGKNTKSLSKAPDPENDVGNGRADAHPYRVDFCGDGKLFAASGYKELTVYRGKDGARLAGAPALKGGFISFSASGRYLSQNRTGKTTIFRLDP